jgi:DNA-binding SARP family transcriptional activator/DNA-binding beta-propeller fold protein YncE
MYYRVLGPIEIEDDGKVLPLGGFKQRALLAVLLLHANEIVSRDVLIDSLWGGRDSSSSTHSLAVQVSRLRTILRTGDNQALVTKPTGYQLNIGDDAFDLLRFERLVESGRLALGSGAAEEAAETLREALALWRGRAFEDVAYESFAQVEVERLEERRLVALEERIKADLAVGHHEELVAELEALVRKHPFREGLRGQLMLALYRSGRQAEALDAYQEVRSELVTNLGIEPGPALRELEQAILRQDPELDAQPMSHTATETHARGGVVRRRSLLIALVLLGVIAAAVGATVALLSDGHAGLAGIAPNSIGVVDPQSGKIVAEIPAGRRPTDLVGDRAIWAANFDSGTLSRIDARTRKVVSVTNAGGIPTGLAVGRGSVWVSNGFANRVLRVDERTESPNATISIGGHPGAIAVDQNGVWVASSISDTVARIDPTSLQVKTIRVGDGPSGIAVGHGSVWVANGLEQTLTRIDSATGAVVRRRIALRFAPAGVAVGAGSVWVTGTAADAVSRVEPETNQSSATIRVGDGPTHVRVLGQDVWVADTFGRDLTEIDSDRNVVVRTVPLGASPEGLASSGGQLWVAAQGS